MRDGWLGDRDLQDLARQAADLLCPEAIVTVDALNGGGRAGSVWGGLSLRPNRPRRVTVSLGTGNECTIGIAPGWTPVHTLAHLLDALGGACGHNFRGTWFPPCAGHAHAAGVDETAEAVLLRCPDSGAVVEQLRPELQPN